MKQPIIYLLYCTCVYSIVVHASSRSLIGCLEYGDVFRGRHYPALVLSAYR